MNKNGFQESGKRRWQCAVKDRTRQARRRAKAKANGLCSECAVRKAVVGKERCQTCLDRYPERYERRVYEEDLCWTCRKPRGLGGSSTQCWSCNREAQKQRIHNAIEDDHHPRR